MTDATRPGPAGATDPSSSAEVETPANAGTSTNAGTSSSTSPGTNANDSTGPVVGADTDALVRDLSIEFSEVFAFARARWNRHAERVNPALRALGSIMLQLIIRQGPITSTEVARHMSLDKAVVSRQVAKLRELGYIDASPAEDDRRVVHLSATQLALDAIGELRAGASKSYQERFASWNEDELTTLLTLLRKFNERPDCSCSG